MFLRKLANFSFKKFWVNKILSFFINFIFPPPPPPQSEYIHPREAMRPRSTGGK